MTLKEIQDLIKFVAKTGVSEVQLEQDDIKLTIKSEGEAREQSVILQAPPVQQIAAAPAAAPVAAAPAAAPATESTNAAEANNNNYVTIKSPMIGTFYRASSPDKPPFVAVGDSVNAGDNLCIIEAMKLFNEIESEVSGKIVKVLVDDSSPVEYDQPLFLVDPS